MITQHIIRAQNLRQIYHLIDRNANISRYYAEEAELKKQRLYDTYHDIDELIPRRIDYLWARGFKKIESCRLCFDEEEGFPASDHFGVAAEIEF